MTDQPKWTPGPWALKIRSGTGESTANEVIAEIEQADPEGGYRGDIARLQSAKHIDGIADEELIANACLLFAAPDLYAALDAIIDGRMWSMSDNKFGAAKAALAKARAASMTAHNVIRLPLDTTVFDRLNAHQRNANIAAERADWVRIARQVLRSPKYYTDQELRDACATLQAWGDGNDYLTADAMILTLDRKERQRAHETAKAAAETPMDVARRFAHRWPEIVSWGAFVAVAMLSATGWLA